MGFRAMTSDLRSPAVEGQRALSLPGRHAVTGEAIERHRVLGCRAFDVVDGEVDASFVAERDEARSRGGQRQLVAHDDILRGVTQLVLAPRDRHQLHGAVEVGHLELDLRRAVRLHGDDAGVEGDRLLNGRAALQAGAVHAVAAGAQLAAFGAHAVDQAAIEVADLQAQHALCVEMILRSRGLEAREVEDADVDGGDRYAGFLASGEAGDLDRDREHRAGLDLGFRRHGDGERARGLVERDPLHADGAAGHALGLLVHRAIEDGRGVGAGAPVVADLEVDFAAALGDVDLLHAVQAAADDGDEGLAAVLGGDAQLGGVARCVARLVERDVEDLGAFELARVGIPAGVEGDGRGRAVGAGRGDVELVAAVVDGGFQLGGRAGSDVERAGLDLALDGLRVIAPRTVAAVPLP